MPGRHQPALAPEVSQLFPSAPVAAAELWGRGDEATLHPEEALIVAGAIDNRRSEFAAGRQCVGLALDRLGHRRAPLLVGNRRSPLWPDTIVGSISHTEGYAVAVVALKDEPADGTTTTVGIDAEQIGRVLEHLHERLFTAAELRYLAELEPDDRDVAATMMFGAKEAFYKAQFAVTEAWVGFHDVETRLGDLGDDGDGVDVGRLIMHPATDLDVLERFVWPLQARSLVRRGIAVTGVEALSR